MELRSTGFAVSAAACLVVSPLLSQQQAPGRGGRGGGFTEPYPIDFNDHNGWTSMFDGKTLNGWDGDKSFWHVEDGAIMVESTGEKPPGQPRGNPPSLASQAKWDMLGPQFDFDGRNAFTGQFYEEATGRGIIAWRGQTVLTEQGKKPRPPGHPGRPRSPGRLCSHRQLESAPLDCTRKHHDSHRQRARHGNPDRR